MYSSKADIAIMIIPCVPNSASFRPRCSGYSTVSENEFEKIHVSYNGKIRKICSNLCLFAL